MAKKVSNILCAFHEIYKTVSKTGFHAKKRIKNQLKIIDLIEWIIYLKKNNKKIFLIDICEHFKIIKIFNNNF